jgi:hypothetical protein
MAVGSNPKKTMRCGEVRPSTRPGKKVMKKYCLPGGKEKLVHAGAKGGGDIPTPLCGLDVVNPRLVLETIDPG